MIVMGWKYAKNSDFTLFLSAHSYKANLCLPSLVSISELFSLWYSEKKNFFHCWFISDCSPLSCPTVILLQNYTLYLLFSTLSNIKTLMLISVFKKPNTGTAFPKWRKNKGPRHHHGSSFILDFCFSLLIMKLISKLNMTCFQKGCKFYHCEYQIST